MMKRVLLVLSAILVPGAGYLLFWPVSIDPVAWEAPEAPELSGVYAQNTLLAKAERTDLPSGEGPEDIAIDAAGMIYGGLLDGRILRFHPNGAFADEFANTGGRPLGMHFDAGGNLIVCDADKGLLSLDSAGTISVLATEAGGVPFRFTDDVDIAADGTIYFSDASHKFSVREYQLDALEHRPNGRLLAYDPQTSSTRVLLDDLYFANGVAVSPDQSFVLVNETWTYEIKRYWLTGEKAGTTDVFIDNLPGFPDGVSTGTDGTFWLALASPRNPKLDDTASSPFLRKIIARLPKWMQPGAIPYAFALGLDLDGNVIHNLQEPTGKPLSTVTSVQEFQGVLYLGSLTEPAFARIARP